MWSTLKTSKQKASSFTAVICFKYSPSDFPSSFFYLSVFTAVVTMSVSDQVHLRSTYPQMTHLLTLYWTPVGAWQSQRSSPLTRVQMLLRAMERRQPALPGLPPPTIPWDCRSSNTLHPFPSPWRQRRLTSRCWRSRDNPSLSCHVTFINTIQKEAIMKTPLSSQQTRSRRTIKQFSPPELLGEGGMAVGSSWGPNSGN